jgi:hypothetical protein
MSDAVRPTQAVTTPPPYPSEADRIGYARRGQGKEIYAKYGGGEAWLKKERAGFYGPFKRKKML